MNYRKWNQLIYYSSPANKCWVCLQPINYGAYDGDWKRIILNYHFVRVHTKECYDYFIKVAKDYSRSRKGRWKKMAEIREVVPRPEIVVMMELAE